MGTTIQKETINHEALFASIVNISEDAFITKTGDGTITTWNKGAEKIFGYTAAEAIGKNISILIPKQEHRPTEGNLEEKTPYETRRIRKNGRIVEILLAVSPVINQEGIVIGTLEIARNLSEQKKIQKNQLKLIDELKKMNQEIESFTYTVSHDLRAPLRAIDGFTKLLEKNYREKLDKEGKELMDFIANNAIKLGNLLEDLLAFSRLGRKEIIKTNIDTRTLVDIVIKESTNAEKKKNVNIIIKDLLPIYGDATLIHQAFFNLIDNALKYSGQRENPVIEIGSYKKGNENVFYVKDNGVGFDMQYQDKLFKVFQRLHAEGEFPGTGVGLAIVAKIINKHGGKVWAEAKPEEGATFYFSLPAT